jgi:nucleoside phosphorylase
VRCTQRYLGRCHCSDSHRLAVRPDCLDNSPTIHYGLVASSNQVMSDGQTRERLWRKINVLCFEVGTVNVMDEFLSLVSRGICDYADTHKNKQCQPYAAAAAAYTKDVLSYIDGLSS